jgi:hypothetical protein
MRAMVIKTTPIIEKVITEEQSYIVNIEAVPPLLSNDHKILQAVFVAGNIKAT